MLHRFRRGMLFLLMPLLVVWCLELPALAQTRRLTAELPNGLTLELVGVTKNIASAKTGWRADGGSLDKIQEWPPGLTFSGGYRTTEYDPEKNPPRPDARDVLIEIRGIKKPISVTMPGVLQLKHSMGLYFCAPHLSGTLPIPDSSPVSKFRVSTLNQLNPKVRTVEILLTDEPWGKIVKVNGSGKPLNPVEKGDLHWETYRCFRLMDAKDPAFQKSQYLTSTLAEGPAHFSLRTRSTRDALLQMQLEVHAVDQSGVRLDAERGTDYENGSQFVDQLWDDALLEEKKFSHFEFRIRPYRYWVKFDNISMERGHKTEPTVTVDVLDEPKLDDKRVYNKLLLNWVRALDTGTDKEKAWAAADIQSWVVDTRPKTVEPRLIKALERCERVEEKVSAATLKKGWHHLSVGDWCRDALSEIRRSTTTQKP